MPPACLNRADKGRYIFHTPARPCRTSFARKSRLRFQAASVPPTLRLFAALTESRLPDPEPSVAAWLWEPGAASPSVAALAQLTARERGPGEVVDLPGPVSLKVEPAAVAPQE